MTGPQATNHYQPPSQPAPQAQTPSTGIVLAAGNNERFQRHYGPDFLKQRLEIQGQPLLIRILNQLESLACSRLLIVAGNHSKALQELVHTHFQGAANIEWIPNTHIERGNGYSLHLGLQKLSPSEPFAHVVMSDHVYGAEFVDQVRSYTRSSSLRSTLFVDSMPEQIFDLDDATKVLHEQGQLLDLGKSLISYNAIDTGWFLLDHKFREIAAALAHHQRQFGVSSLVEAYQKHYPFHCHLMHDAPWQDVDNPAMFEAAQKLFS